MWKIAHLSLIALVFSLTILTGLALAQEGFCTDTYSSPPSYDGHLAIFPLELKIDPLETTQVISFSYDFSISGGGWISAYGTCDGVRSTGYIDSWAGGSGSGSGSGAMGFNTTTCVNPAFVIENSAGTATYTNIEITKSCTGDNCDTLENAHFVDDSAWDLGGWSSITASILTLPNGSIAAQGVNITPYQSYRAVIVVSGGSGDVSLSLGGGAQIINVTGAGRYTTTLSTQGSGQAIYLMGNASVGSSSVNVDWTCVYPADQGDTTCDTIPNSHFTSSANWTLNRASITDTYVVLLQQGSAQQNLNLSPGYYSGVISITDVISSAAPQLTINVGSQAVSVGPLTHPGSYEFNFQLTAQDGPTVFSLNAPDNAIIAVDYVCIFIGEQADCLAPDNGTFNSQGGWNWLRGAQWVSPANVAGLPFADSGMIVSSDTYSMPTLSTDERLIVSFTAHETCEGGGITGLAQSGGSSTNFVYETYSTDYLYEANLLAVAGQSNVRLSFANSIAITGPYTSTADVVIDNICVFVANRPPNLPAPADTSSIDPISTCSAGFGSSCADLDAVWAWFGINMPEYRAIYAAGTSVWDPIGWVPWLISAMWVTLAAWACFFYAAYLSLMDLILYFLNSVMNIGNWIIRQLPLFIAWLNSWWVWLYTSVYNLAVSFGYFFWQWLKWIGDGIGYLVGVIGLTISAALGWIGSLVTNFNGLRTILNWVIAAWNLLIEALGYVISALLDAFFIAWNGVAEALVSGWLLTTALIGVGIDFVLSAWGLFVFILTWLWTNVILMAYMPIQFYNGFSAGISSEAFNSMIECSGSGFWCSFLAGVQILNQTAGQSVLYPIVIVGIIIATGAILWKNIFKLFTIEIQ